MSLMRHHLYHHLHWLWLLNVMVMNRVLLMHVMIGYVLNHCHRYWIHRHYRRPMSMTNHHSACENIIIIAFFHHTFFYHSLYHSINVFIFIVHSTIWLLSLLLLRQIMTTNNILSAPFSKRKTLFFSDITLLFSFFWFIFFYFP